MALTSDHSELIISGVLLDGARIRIRPIRPEDEPLLQDILTHMTPEDVQFRFLESMRRLPDALATRLARIDYDREMALIAFAERSELPLGVARYAVEPDDSSAEFAIAVRSDWKNRGLGYFLLARLIEIARQRGLHELFGFVHLENGAMLQLCRSLDFSISAEPHGPGLIRVTKALAAES